MKTSIWLLLVLFVFSGCSTFKIAPTQWVSEDFKNQKFDHILVYASTDDTNLQATFEDKMAIALAEIGIRPLKMHQVFPQIEYKENHSQEDIITFVLQCKQKNIDKILLVSQKSISVDTVVTNSLHNYMNSIEPLKLGSEIKENMEYDKKQLTTYTLEAAVYDIAASTEDKPIAATILKATNPKSSEKLQKSFLNAIVKLFKSK